MAEGLNVNERGEIQGASATAEAIAFVTEFNQNARIFNETIAPLMGEMSDLKERLRHLTLRVGTLETVNGNTADDPDFRDCDHVAPGQPC